MTIVRQLFRRLPEPLKRPLKTRLQRQRILKNKYPQRLVLETTTRCNANCVYCGRPDEDHDMSLDLFKAIVDASPFVGEVYPQTRGEPLLYPYLIEAIEHCKRRGKHVAFYTNGSLLHLECAELLLISHVDTVYLSIDDYDPIRFSKVRRGLSLTKIVKNLRQFIALRDAMNAPTNIYVRATLSDTNRDHQQEIREFFSFADGFWFINEIGVIRGLPLHSWVSDRPFLCPEPFLNLAIRWNGQAVLCCNDWEDNFPVGKRLQPDVTEEDILTVFRKVQDIGRQMLQGNIPAPCTECMNRWQNEDRMNEI